MLGFVTYSPAIFQEGNPLPIVQAAIRLQLSNEKIVPIDSERYMTETEDSNDIIISFMKSKEWVFKDQFGSGFLFEKQGNSLTVVCRQYSKYFKVWKIPRLE